MIFPFAIQKLSLRQGQLWSRRWNKISKSFGILASTHVSYFTSASHTSKMFTSSLLLCLRLLLFRKCEPGLKVMSSCTLNYIVDIGMALTLLKWYGQWYSACNLLEKRTSGFVVSSRMTFVESVVCYLEPGKKLTSLVLVWIKLTTGCYYTSFMTGCCFSKTKGILLAMLRSIFYFRHFESKVLHWLIAT